MFIDGSWIRARGRNKEASISIQRRNPGKSQKNSRRQTEGEGRKNEARPGKKEKRRDEKWIRNPRNSLELQIGA